MFVVKAHKNEPLEDLELIFRRGKCAAHTHSMDRAAFGSSDECQHGHPEPKHHEFSSECQRQGGGTHLAVNRWLNLICINSFTNQNQRFMCFGR